MSVHFKLLARCLSVVDVASRKVALHKVNLRMAAVVVLGAVTSACVPLVVGGAVGGAFVATDRRSVGIQIEDDTIERRVSRAVTERAALTPVNVDVISYNRRVLLTGEVPTEALKADLERAAQGAENVREVVNDLGVGQLSSFGSRTNDAVIASKVRAALLDTDGVPTGVIKVTVTRAKVYLAGRVTQTEADAAARAVSRISGVEQVVKIFEVLSDAEVRTLGGARPAAPEVPPRR